MHDTITIALDRSVRRLDIDGRLHVELTNISKATVNPYYGREIPGAQELGLKPDTIYQVFRDPEALAKAAATFNNVPLLDEHVIVSADDPKKNNIVGSTGTDAEFNGEYLRNSLVIWDRDAIARIESGEQKEISCAYRYVAVKESGSYKGLTFDLKMMNIQANHVALVREGRAGPDVVVADGKLGDVKMKFHPVKAKLAAKFAIDSALTPEDRRYLTMALDDMETEVEGEDAEPDEEASEAEAKKKAEDMKAKDKAAKDKMVKDAKRAKDKAARDKKAKDESEEDEDAEKAEDESEEDEEKEEKAMDSRIKLATDKAVAQTIAKMEAVAKAKSEVAPIVGEVHGLDSAEAVYRFALDSASIAHKDIKELAALQAMVQMLPKPNSQTTIVALDSKTRSSVGDLFPQLRRFA